MKSFFDNTDKPTQNQVKNETGNYVLATQSLYDFQGRAAGATLPAPINSLVFSYKTNFMTSGGNSYNYTNFDGDPAFSAYQKVNAPDPVDYATQGTLGWYYSENNNQEPGVASTRYPYSRIDFYHDGSMGVKRSTGVDALRMGSGHEQSSFSFPVGTELGDYLSVRNKFYTTGKVGILPATLYSTVNQANI